MYCFQCIIFNVNLGRLHRIGRHLQELAIQAMRDPGDPDLSRAQRVIQGDVYLHPGTSVGEIATRTGFTQGHVSASLARLRELGRVSTETDPAERRRTLVQLTPLAAVGIRRRTTRGADELLAKLYDDVDETRLREIIGMLDDLDRRLTRVVADSRPQRTTPRSPTYSDD